MLWLGIDEQQKYAIAFMGSFASVLVYTTDATLRVDQTLISAAHNLGADRLQVIRHVVLPGSLPNILSGLKVVLAIAWTCVISAEMVGANSGLGFRIWTAKEWSDTGQVLVDEPFAALDAMTRQILQQELLQLVADTGKTVLFITHSIDEARILSDRLAVMSARPGRVKEIYDNALPRPPQHGRADHGPLHRAQAQGLGLGARRGHGVNDGAAAALGNSRRKIYPPHLSFRSSSAL
jgi:hypothetical protein